MSIKTQPVTLTQVSATEHRVVKRCALGLFRLVRGAADQAQKVPGLLQQAAADVVQAWEETSRPKS